MLHRSAVIEQVQNGVAIWQPRTELHQNKTLIELEYYDCERIIISEMDPAQDTTSWLVK